MGESDISHRPSDTVQPNKDAEEQGRKKNWSLFKIILVITALSAGLTLTYPEALVLLAFSYVGIPVAIYLGLAPTFLFYLLVCWALHWWLQKQFSKRWLAVAVSGIVGLVLLAIPAFLSNLMIGQSASQLIAKDHDDIVRPANVKTIAWHQFGKSKSQCDGFCLYALLSGAADQILMVETAFDGTLSDLSSVRNAVSYRLIKQDGCFVPVELQRGYAGYPKRGKDSQGRAVNLIESLNRRINQGQCLVRTTDGDFGKADLIVTRHSERSYGGGGSFSLDAYDIKWSRISVLQPGDHAGDLNEIYRWTGGIVAWMSPVLVFHPDLSFFPGGSKADWLRRNGPIAEGHGRLDEQTWSHFLEEILQFRLPTPDEHPA